jgi:hypothetical protein
MPFTTTHWSKIPELREKVIEKIRISNIGKKQSQETIEKRASKIRGRVSPMLGRHQSKEAREKIGAANKGRSSWIKGKKWTNEMRAKIESTIKREDKSSNWKGNEVGYTGLHAWVRRKLGEPILCKHCSRDINESLIEWANISHEYKRDLTDWISLCRSCHRKFDLVHEVRDRDSMGRFI